MLKKGQLVKLRNLIHWPLRKRGDTFDKEYSELISEELYKRWQKELGEGATNITDFDYWRILVTLPMLF